MATIYRKTDKGQHEIATREHRLPPRLRTALIMVDGKRRDDELRTLIAQQADDTLATLLDQGFIAVATVLDDRRADPPAAPARTPAAARTEPRATEPSTVPAEDFAAVRRDAVRQLLDLVGPLGEAVAMRMDQAKTPEALKPLIELAARVVSNTRGTKTASDYYQKFSEALER